MESDWDDYVIDFDSYSAQFACSPEAQAEVARRDGEAAERKAAKQAQWKEKEVLMKLSNEMKKREWKKK